MYRLRSARLFTAVLFALSISLVPAAGAVIQVAATLDPSQEVAPPAIPPGLSGTGLFTGAYDNVSNQLSYQFSFSGLSGTTVPVGEFPAHIHRAPRGANGPIVFPLPSPVGVTSTPPLMGTLMLTEEQEADLLAGLYYVNVHTTSRTAGEIRGQIQAIPEPGTWALMAAGVGALALRRRMS